MRWSYDRITTDGDLSVEAISPDFMLESQNKAYVRIKWTGTPIGTFYLQSAGNERDGEEVPEFVDMTGETRVVLVSEGPGSHTWADPDCPDFKFRVRWQPELGSVGVVQIWIGGKGV